MKIIIVVVVVITYNSNITNSNSNNSINNNDNSDKDNYTEGNMKIYIRVGGECMYIFPPPDAADSCY